MFRFLEYLNGESAHDEISHEIDRLARPSP